MTDEKYNGWTNYATWRVNLEMIDGIDAEAFGFDPDHKTNVADVADDIKTFVHQFVDQTADGLVINGRNPEAYGMKSTCRDYANAFLDDVNWYEIAEHKIEEYA